MSTPGQRLAEQYARANQTCAAIILADPEKFGGEGSLMVEWVKLMLTDPSEREKPEPEFTLVA